MKTNTLKVLTALIAFTLMLGPSVWAAPERLEIRKTEEKARQQMSRTRMKNVDLRNIEDPEARKAIHEIMNYLNLQPKA